MASWSDFLAHPMRQVFEQTQLFGWPELLCKLKYMLIMECSHIYNFSFTQVPTKLSHNPHLAANGDDGGGQGEVSGRVYQLSEQSSLAGLKVTGGSMPAHVTPLSTDTKHIIFRSDTPKTFSMF